MVEVKDRCMMGVIALGNNSHASRMLHAGEASSPSFYIIIEKHANTHMTTNQPHIWKHS